MSLNPTRSWARLDGVDLLRSLAILFVLMNHVNIRLVIAKVPFAIGLWRQFADSLFYNGESGVHIFFAVSGFLITSTSLRRWGSPAGISVGGFYRLRFARIAPLLGLLLTVLSVLHFGGIKDFVVSTARGGLGQALFAALTFHVNVLEARRGYLPGSWDILWSLSIEEMFYLFFPLAFHVLGRGKLLVVVLLGFVVLGPFARTTLAHGNELWGEYSYLGGMSTIALGCLTALFLARRRLSRFALWIVGSLESALMVFILGFSLTAYRWGIDRTGLDMTILALGTCLVIAVVAQTEWRSPRVIAPFLLLGQHSYEIYLTHMFVVFALLHLFVMAGKPIWAVPVYFIAAICSAGILGEFAARLYSEPMNRGLRKRWGDGQKELGSVIEQRSYQIAN